MARQTEVHLVDDLDNGPADETVKFSIDGRHYEIDLNSANAAKLREGLAHYIEHGRRAVTAGRAAAARRPRAAANDVSHVREWARARGMSVSSRGRLSAHVLAAYENAQTAE